MAEKKVAVIGAGLGGLAAAIRLRVMGYKVSVYEKNQEPGGKASEIYDCGFRFDTGPSLVTMPFVLEELFKFAGEKIENFITLKKLDKLCRYFYPDGSVIDAYSDVQKFASEIEKNTTDSAGSVVAYLDYCRTIYNLSGELFLFKSFTEFSSIFNAKAFYTLLNILKLDTHRTMHRANSSFFNDGKTIQLFDRYATYNGSNPFKAPATLNIIQHVEYNMGGYVSSGGIYSIPKALTAVAENKGVEFNFNSEVNGIIRNGNRVTGIRVDGSEKLYDIVVSNSDVKNTYNNLLKDNNSRASKKYDDLEMSTSALVFYWGIKGNYPGLEIHNILFSEDYRKEFSDLFDAKIIPEDPTVYIYISSKFNGSDAPENCENWFVMINAPRNINQNWNYETEKARKHILRKIKNLLSIDVEADIITENILTPEILEKKTSSTGGSIYGISSNTRLAAFLRQRNRSGKYKGLYFTGGSAHPGGGIPLVLLSGKITADLIKKYEMN
ncbi:MAG: phytoene desaturase [Melioribacteraceae bacterium]|nr:phytoene desaturase [Melioribacteraceae bacterium]